MADDQPDPVTRDSFLLYDECSKVALDSDDGFSKTFDQNELLACCKHAGLSKILDITALMPLVQLLSSGNFFINLKRKGGALCWSLRRRDAAKQMQKLTQEEKMVYIMVEESQSQGVWMRSIRRKTGLTEPGANKILDKLLKLKLIKSIKTIKSPAQKTYILSHLVPSEDVTGGSFYDSGELDENLVEELANLIVYFVRQASWVEEKRRKVNAAPADRILSPDDDRASPEDTRGRKRRKGSNTRDIEDAGPMRKAHRYEYVQISHAAHHRYPNVDDIHGFITGNNFMREAKSESLSIDEIQNIVNMLVWDDKLECINGGYRTLRGVKQPKMSGQEQDDAFGMKFLDESARRGNGLTEMPCGRCPVVDICGTGGPINASTCVYFEQWLGVALDAVGEKRGGTEVEIL